MTQQINLYTLLPKKPRFVFSTKTVFSFYGLWIVLLSIHYAMQLFSQHQLTHELKSVMVESGQIQQQLLDINKQYPLLDLENSEKSVQQLAAEMNTHAKVMGLLSHDSLFSHYLTALAESVVPGVWLTEIHFSLTDQSIYLKGHAIQAQLAQDFMAKLTHHPTFHPIQFQLDEIAAVSGNNAMVDFNITTQSGSSA